MATTTAASTAVAADVPKSLKNHRLALGLSCSMMLASAIYNHPRPPSPPLPITLKMMALLAADLLLYKKKKDPFSLLLHLLVHLFLSRTHKYFGYCCLVLM